ncbi:nitrilase-related carbon-nitrogen hydrolase [Amycolatopsis taiwanensis]|uniref:nitrilase-related carbon-nitrogen hydrolase n=1 Tax=Amycolatopsis taiwanensis TaxID=342230 RepID=UPI0004B41805|nr:nitrilase-related carbon-nitrogen hydrolase [Amycolatopsis taiwanensis]
METKVLPAVAAVAASAALFFFGTGLAPIAALAWIAPLPVLLLAPRVGATTAVVAAFLAYLLGTANSWSYFLHSLSIPLPAALLIVVGGAGVFALATLLFRALSRAGRPLLAMLSAPSVWVTALFAASLASPTGVVGTLATTQADVPVVLQLAAITGSWGVEFLVLLVPAAVAACAAPGVATAARLRTGAVMTLAVAAMLTYGFVRLSDVDDHAERLAVVAATEPHWAVDVAGPAGRLLVQSYVDEIAGLPDGIRMVVLPEASFAADEASLPALVEPLSQVARAKGADIVVGALSTENGQRFNTALDIRPGQPSVAYHKWHNGGASNVQSGHELAMPGGIGLAVCMDVNFPDPSRDYARAGARFVAIPASDEDVDGWQHSRAALLRAVENGFSVAWSDQRGLSILADSRGRVLAEAATGGPAPFAVAIADVPAGTGPTFAARFGDWFPWLCAALTLVGLAAAAVRRRPTAGTQSGQPGETRSLRVPLR